MTDSFEKWADDWIAKWKPIGAHVWINEDVASKANQIVSKNDEEMMYEMLWITIEQIDGMDNLLIDGWAIYLDSQFKIDWAESSIPWFLADHKDAGGKWNTQAIALSEKNNHPGLLITSDQNFQPDYMNSIGDLKKILSGTESYFIYMDFISGKKQVIKIWEDVAPKIASFWVTDGDKIFNFDLESKSEQSFLISIFKIFSDIPKEDQIILWEYFEKSGINLEDSMNLNPKTALQLKRVFQEFMNDSRITKAWKNIIQLLVESWWNA